VFFFGALSYYIAQKYTPHNKFAWALQIKNEVEEARLFMCRHDDRIEEIILEERESFLRTVKFLYIKFEDLASAHQCLSEAPVDLPGDIAFKQECEELAREIEGLLHEIESYARRIVLTHQWVKEVFRCEPSELHKGIYVSELVMDSFEWSLLLVESLGVTFTKSPSRELYYQAFDIFFSELFMSSLQHL